MNNKNLNLLIQAYYERMMAYDQASNATTDKDLKYFFEEQANESENIVKAIEVETNNTLNLKTNSYVLPATKLFSSGMYKKSYKFIIDSVKQLEKNMANTYNTLVDDVKKLPINVANILQHQKKMLRNNTKYLSTY